MTRSSVCSRGVRCDPDGGDDESDTAQVSLLTFFGILQLLKLGFTVSLRHQAMVLLDELPFFRVIS